ncbi:hypothetical protein Syun_013663 [Stephania yunnanensis]|uniref:STAS domain-containing protein n=1 Tax=Stephania yunnanensis TaxID=152371 RepID=A0AAP0P7Y4_9MAGN
MAMDTLSTDPITTPPPPPPPPTSHLEMEDGALPVPARLVLNGLEPPGALHEFIGWIKETMFPNAHMFKNRPASCARSVLPGLFPILRWCRAYKAAKFKNDLMAGLTLASLSIPQSIGYANLAKLDPQYGLLECTEFSSWMFLPYFPTDCAISGRVNFRGKKKKKLFWIPAIAPLLSVILSTLFVFLTRADKHGVQDSSTHQRRPESKFIAPIAVQRPSRRRSRKSWTDHRRCSPHGSFSRTAVNFSAGCETVVSNIVMAVTVLGSLVLFTKLLYFTPITILASIILSALPGLIDLNEAYKIWKVDKLDFLACIGAFFGVLFASVEIGLLTAVSISFLKIIVSSIKPGTEVLGRLPGTNVFCSISQYKMAVKVPGLLVMRIDTALLCFANANFVKERIIRWVTLGEEEELGESGDSDQKDRIQVLILDLSKLMNIDTSGIIALEELHKRLISRGIELALANPSWSVIHKLKLVKFVEKIGGRVFFTVNEAVNACIGSKMLCLMC